MFSKIYADIVDYSFRDSLTVVGGKTKVTEEKASFAELMRFDNVLIEIQAFTILIL